MKTTGNPTRHARHVRGGVIQNKPPKRERRAQATQAEFAENVNRTIETANLLLRVGAYIGAFLFVAVVVILLAIVATL